MPNKLELYRILTNNRHLCYVKATSRSHAAKVARNAGFKLPKSSRAIPVSWDEWQRETREIFHLANPNCQNIK